MEIGLELEVVYRDRDLLKINFSAWNGAFGGATVIYLGNAGLGEIAEKVQGFPRWVADTREVTLGDFDPAAAGGGVKLRFYCSDASGHISVDVNVQSEQVTQGIFQSASLSVPIEAAAVDSFVGELHQIEVGERRTATLKGKPGTDGMFSGKH